MPPNCTDAISITRICSFPRYYIFHLFIVVFCQIAHLFIFIFYADQPRIDRRLQRVLPRRLAEARLAVDGRVEEALSNIVIDLYSFDLYMVEAVVCGVSDLTFGSSTMSPGRWCPKYSASIKKTQHLTTNAKLIASSGRLKRERERVAAAGF